MTPTFEEELADVIIATVKAAIAPLQRRVESLEDRQFESPQEAKDRAARRAKMDEALDLQIAKLRKGGA